MPKAQIGEIEIYYEQRGNGEPVLLVPPSWWPSDTWKVSVVPFLSKRFKTIIFDCRGTGRSEKPTTGYSVSQFARDCAGLLEHMHISRCHAVGFALADKSFKHSALNAPIWSRHWLSRRRGRDRKGSTAARAICRRKRRGKFASWGLSDIFADTSTMTAWLLTRTFTVPTVMWRQPYPTLSGQDKARWNNFVSTKKRV